MGSECILTILSNCCIEKVVIEGKSAIALKPLSRDQNLSCPPGQPGNVNRLQYSPLQLHRWPDPHFSAPHLEYFL